MGTGSFRTFYTLSRRPDSWRRILDSKPTLPPPFCFNYLSPYIDSIRRFSPHSSAFPKYKIYRASHGNGYPDEDDQPAQKYKPINTPGHQQPQRGSGTEPKDQARKCPCLSADGIIKDKPRAQNGSLKNPEDEAELKCYTINHGGVRGRGEKRDTWIHLLKPKTAEEIVNFTGEVRSRHKDHANK
jgi:hypothetical protein